MRSIKLKLFSIVFIVIMVMSLMLPLTAQAAKKKYDSWEAVATDMAKVFDDGIEDVKNDKYEDAYKHINDAYFGYYEVQGFEKNVMVYISSDRVGHIEGMFSDIKHTLLGNMQGHKDDIVKSIESLKVKVYRDAMVLDGKVSKSSSDKVGEKVYGDKPVPDRHIDRDQNIKNDQNTEVAQQVIEEQKSPEWVTFITSFGLLLREGLEALLIIVAIVAYLIKTGNKKLVKAVYLGSLAAVGASIILAILVEQILGGIGAASELIEGYTMFIAVAVLFYVSNWMLSKSDTEAWEGFIQGKVEESIDKKSKWTLVFAAFLAVLREGAELILFYKASFSSGMSNPLYIGLGMLAGAALLAVIYVAFRFFSVKLPLRPFFLFTSILLFLMCISFMGKGVVELTEGNVISGRTVIPAMNGFKIGILNVYDRAETLIPQLMLTVASAWMVISNILSNRRKKKARLKAEN